MSSQVFGDDLHKLYPVIEHGMSDSGCFDNVVEFLCYAGLRQLPEVSHSQLMMTFTSSIQSLTMACQTLGVLTTSWSFSAMLGSGNYLR